MQHREKIITWSCFYLLLMMNRAVYFQIEIETFNLKSRAQAKKENYQKKLHVLCFSNWTAINKKCLFQFQLKYVVVELVRGGGRIKFML